MALEAGQRYRARMVGLAGDGTPKLVTLEGFCADELQAGERYGARLVGLAADGTPKLIAARQRQGSGGGLVAGERYEARLVGLAADGTPKLVAVTRPCGVETTCCELNGEPPGSAPASVLVSLISTNCFLNGVEVTLPFVPASCAYTGSFGVSAGGCPCTPTSPTPLWTLTYSPWLYPDRELHLAWAGGGGGGYLDNCAFIPAAGVYFYGSGQSSCEDDDFFLDAYTSGVGYSLRAIVS